MGRDSNPRRACTLNGFQDRRIRPLCHLSLSGFAVQSYCFFLNYQNFSCLIVFFSKFYDEIKTVLKTPSLRNVKSFVWTCWLIL